MDNYNELDLIETISECHLNYKIKGKELVLEKCPFCENGREKPSDHFSFLRNEGIYNCIKCGQKGNLYTFRREMGLNPWKDTVYRIPDQEYAKSLTVQPETYFMAFEASRGIPEEILRRYGVGKAVRDDIGVCRTYQYVDTDGTVVNIKYVNSKKEMRQEKNSKQIYYGLQFLNYSKEVLHVTEGEDDCHALIAIGIDNVVSVPGGAKAYSEDMGKINSKFKQILLFFDNDKVGQEGAESFAQKAGVWKCRNVVLPFKDARECLKHGIDIFAIQKFINEAHQFKYSTDAKLRPGLHISERLDRYENDCRLNFDGIRFGFVPIDEITGGLRGGDLFSIVANPGCFKTTALMNLLKMSVENSKTGIALFFSLEMQIEAEVERELQIYTQHPPYLMRDHARLNSKEWKTIRNEIECFKYNRIYVSEESGISVGDMGKIIERTEEAAHEKCIITGIDYLDFINSGNQREYESVKSIMIELKKLLKKKNLPGILLAQTSRESKSDEEEVGLRSGKGGTAIESTSDFYIGMWRHEDRIIGRFAKHRRLDAGTIENPYLSFHIDRKNYLINNICICEKPRKKKKGKDTEW